LGLRGWRDEVGLSRRGLYGVKDWPVLRCGQIQPTTKKVHYMGNNTRRRLVLLGTTFWLFTIMLVQAQPTPPTTFRGVNNEVRAIAVAPNGDVYVGGNFTQAGNIYASYIAKWTPATRMWSKLEAAGGQGAEGVGGPVNSIVIDSQGTVYVGGEFGSIAGGSITAKNVAVWNPAEQTWSNLGGGVYNNGAPQTSRVKSLSLAGGYLHVGGAFVFAGAGTPVNNIARFQLSTSQWLAMGNPGFSVSRVRDWSGGTYISTDQFIYGGSGVYKYSGSTWDSVDPNNAIYGRVYDFLFRDTINHGYAPFHYIGGSFGIGAPSPAVGLADYWRYCEFSPPYGCPCYHTIPNGPPSATINGMATSGVDVVFVGSFNYTIQQAPYATPRNVVVRHEVLQNPYPPNPTSSSWSTLGAGSNNGVNGPAAAVAVVGNLGSGFVYIGGEFTEAGDGITANNVAVWDAANNKWAALANNEPPTVSVSSPANGDVYLPLATIPITAEATDDSKVIRVEFYQGSTLLGTDTTAPYSFSWGNVPAGTYSLTAKAYDNEGEVTTSAAIAVIVDAPPTVAITSPANGAVVMSPANITISANASDDGSIAKVEFFHGTTQIGSADTTYPYSVTWSGVSPGTYVLTAKATDNYGVETTSEAVTIKVDAPPTVTITSPVNGAVFASPADITIDANATDSDGSIAKVEFFHGTSQIGSADTASPYSVTWNSVSASTYVLTAKATDDDGAVTVSQPVVVRVDSSILAGPVVRNGHTYYLVSGANWNSAEGKAVSLGGHLATINDAAENAWVLSTFGSIGGVDRHLWIGLNDKVDEGTFTWSSGEDATFSNWLTGEPNNGEGWYEDPNEDAVVLSAPNSGIDGQWIDVPENWEGASVGVVEIDPSQPTILSGPTVYNGHVYYLLNTANWNSAEAGAVGLGGHLAEINDAVENTWVLNTFGGFGAVNRYLWIGLNDRKVEGTFAWSSGAALTYHNWMSGEPNNGVGWYDDPNEDAVVMKSPNSGNSGQWIDVPEDWGGAGGGVVEVVPEIPDFVLFGPIEQSGHSYYLVSSSDWNDAEAKAVGLGGHLVTINDATENAWILNTFGSVGDINRNLWIGLNDKAVEGTFAWISGDSLSYSNWLLGEPNNGLGYSNEDAVFLGGPNYSAPGFWVDAPEDWEGANAAVVEVSP
jgi:hypothetical protein